MTDQLLQGSDTPVGSEQAAAAAEPAAELGVARELSELARELHVAQDAPAVLERIVRAAREDLVGAWHAGITLRRRGAVSTPVATGDLPGRIDALQRQLDEGPCLRSSQHRTVRCDDLGTDSRWPTFGHRAAALGVRSMLSVPLFVQGEDFGVLNFYAAGTDAFSDEDEQVAELLAAHAAVALAAVDKTDNLQTSLRSRDVIGQAKGILMERFKLDEQGAFEALVTVSQRANRKLRDVAEHLAMTGDLPTVL